MSEAPGPINFTMFLTMFGEKLNGTDPEDVIRNAFACFDEEASGQTHWRPGLGRGHKGAQCLQGTGSGQTPLSPSSQGHVYPGFPPPGCTCPPTTCCIKPSRKQTMLFSTPASVTANSPRHGATVPRRALRSGLLRISLIHVLFPQSDWRPEQGLLALSPWDISRAGRGGVGVARACPHWPCRAVPQGSSMRTTFGSCSPPWATDSQTRRWMRCTVRHPLIRRATSTTWSSPASSNTAPRTKTTRLSLAVPMPRPYLVTSPAHTRYPS